MRKIHGRILVKETNSPVSNLVVAAYDSEDRSSNDNSSREKDFRITAQFVKHLGKRIGSVITDKQGNFSMNHSDLQFEGIESRPDLIIAVFAPEDTPDDLTPFPLPPEQRLLYVSAAPRDDAGSEEAYMIRLRQRQLEKFQIGMGGYSTGNETDGLPLIMAIERSYTLSDQFKEKLAPRINAAMEITANLKKDALKIFKDFSLVRNTIKNHPLYVADKKSLPEVHKQVIDEGLKRLKNYEGNLMVSLTNKQATLVGLEVSKNGTVKGQVKSAQLLSILRKVNAISGGLDLIRTRELGDKSIEAMWEKYTQLKVINDKNSE